MSVRAVPEHDPSWRQPAWRGRLRRRLLGWYAHAARDLPWRRSPDAYRIWVSEVMLQQTQVATVEAYFRRFIDSFPTVASLAAASEADVLRHWEGLGYYRRARQLHAAARRIVERHGGEFPRRYDDVLALPGIGRYTAGAILSIAHDARLPVVEANTMRLYSRLIALRAAPAAADASRLLWEVAQAALPRRGSGTFNQAAMEIGSLVCTPKSPRCDACPLRPLCGAHAQGLEESIPGRVKKVRYEERTEFAIAAMHADGRILLRQRPAGERWAGLWDFPRAAAGDLSGDTSDRSPPPRLARAATAEAGIALRIGPRLTTIRHAVTRFRITLHLHAAEPVGTPGPVEPPAAWFHPSELAELPLSTPARRLADFLAQHRAGGMP